MDWLEYEKMYMSQGYKMVCGVDEAGRGPLAGDVYAAAVILPEGVVIEGVNDSKKLSEKKREYLFDLIKEKSLCYSIASASAKEIDELNILQATFLAMKRAVDDLNPKADFAMVDGNRKPNLDIPLATIIKGDSLSCSIAAASILAKVTRDRVMKEEALRYPNYFFEKHKGYGTKLHFEMIEKYGPCPIHRRTFLKNILKNK